jgi:hypothetical protein
LRRFKVIELLLERLSPGGLRAGEVTTSGITSIGRLACITADSVPLLKLPFSLIFEFRAARVFVGEGY